jgi:hypothetical protein
MKVKSTASVVSNVLGVHDLLSNCFLILCVELSAIDALWRRRSVCENVAIGLRRQLYVLHNVTVRGRITLL